MLLAAGLMACSVEEIAETVVDKVLESSYDTAEKEAEGDPVLNSGEVKWFNASYGIYIAVSGGSHNLLGGFTDVYRDAVINSLEESWGVTGRAELDEMIASLREGRHNQSFLEELREMELDIMSRDVLENILAGDYYEDEDRYYFLHFYDAYDRFGENAILGWDYSRATQLAGLGYVAGYYSREECLDSSLESARLMQASFDSWDDFVDSYLYGYIYWSEEVPEDETSEAYQRQQIYQQLKVQKDGPYSIDWNTPLEKVW